MEHDAAFATDHRRAYNIDGVEVEIVVALEGQFDKGPKKRRLVAIDHFANPVDKNGEGILDEQAHQTWYAIHPDDAAEPVRRVTFTNQFGDQEIVIGDAAILITPAEKEEPGSSMPEGQDHYLCYTVLKGESVGRSVSLRDQFQGTRNRVSEPLLFGVPVSKEYEKLEPILNGDAHLTVYRLDPTDNHEVRVVRDQFDEYELEILATALLAVPTRKNKWAVEG